MILVGDVREKLREIAPKSIQTCVTSPPYWGLRDYGVAGQLGLEKTPQEYVENMVEVFQLVRELLADDGTLWLNLGDSYAGSWGAQSREHAGKHAPNVSVLSANQVKAAQIRASGTGSLSRTPGLKTKDLCGIPWRVAFALQADGWWLRQDIIWSKNNPMPESVRDRCTKAHEYIFMLTKSDKYYFDNVAIQEPLASSSVPRLSQDVENQQGSDRVPGKTKGRMKAVYTKPYTGKATKDYAAGGAQDASATKARIVDRILSGEITGRNKRSVWTVTTKPFKGAHFATFPPDLIEPCILAGSKPGDTVLDPFGGSGTTGMVADRHGRKYVLIELNPAYATMAEKRIVDDREKRLAVLLK